MSHHRRDGPTTMVNLTGMVIAEDGQPADDLVQVELICNGRIKQQTLTTPDGSFFFELGSPRSDDWLDPSVGGSADGTVEGTGRAAPAGRNPRHGEMPSMGQGRMPLSGCEVRASPRPGLTSNVIPLSTRSAFDNPDIGVIVVRRLSDTGATTVSLSTLSAPRNARKAFEKASAELGEPEPDVERALNELKKAVKEYPGFSAAWDLRGRAHMARGESSEARECFLRAIGIEPKFIKPYMALAQMSVQESDWSGTAEWAGKVLEFDSSLPEALYWNGLASYYLKDFERSEKSLSKLYKLGHTQKFPFGLLPLGVIHAGQGRIQEAAREFQLYLAIMPTERVTDAQRSELRRQLALWHAEGVSPQP